MKQEEPKERRALGLTLIAIGKLIKVSVLLTAGVAALLMAHDPPHALLHWSHVLGVDAANHWLHLAIATVSGVSAHRLHELGVGSFVYATIFAVEGTGLWLQKKWAEYLTVLVTLSFVPFEIYEIAHRFSAVKVVTLALNLVALAYLLVRLMGQRAHGRLDSASR
jgi:uncharacterized membrane protein (DUF2068 family)